MTDSTTRSIEGTPAPGRWHYAYDIPQRWFRLVLGDDSQEEALGTQFDEQLGETWLGPQRPVMLRMLDGYAADARAAGAVDAAVMLDIVNEMAVTAQLMLQIVDRSRPDDTEAELRAITDELIVPRDNDLRPRRLAWVDLPAGRAVHVVAVVDAPAEPASGAVVLVDQHWIPVPGYGHTLVVGLTTSQLALEEPFGRTAAAIAESVTLTA